MVSNPFKTGRYCVEVTGTDGDGIVLRVSNPFKTGRYCVESVAITIQRQAGSFKPLQNGAVLRRPRRWNSQTLQERFKPLQNGAVLRRDSKGASHERFENGFKPLQNGAVLRSFVRHGLYCRVRGVSNPFKTGRYCVVTTGAPGSTVNHVFQTPSKRGGTA